MERALLLLLVNAASALYMVGLIWFVQVVHYPLFQRVGAKDFVPYEQNHQRLTTWVTAPVMLLEAVLSVALVYVLPTSGVSWVAGGGERSQRRRGPGSE